MIVILKNYSPSIDTALLALTIQFAFEISNRMAFAIKTFGEVDNMMTSSQRVIQYTEMKSEDELVKSNDDKSWPQISDINFREVYMRYRPHLEPVLKNMTHYIQSGEKVGVIGRSGAGKSSIVQALFRLVEIEDISSIHIGGENIRNIGLHTLRNSIAFIPQTPFLMSTTIRKNLDPFKRHSEEVLWDVLEQVKLRSYVE